MPTENITELFLRISRQYFPQWADVSQWRAVPSDVSNGCCDRDARTILIGSPTENYELDVLIAHEIAHVTTTGDHGNDWIAEMQRVADQAEVEGASDLAQRLHEHLEWVDSGDDVGELEVEGAVRDAVRKRQGLSYEQIVKTIASSYGQSLELFTNQFKRCEEWYRDAKKSIVLQNCRRKRVAKGFDGGE